MSPNMNQITIAPSMLCVDFARLGEQTRQIGEAGADWLHFDIMDGNFVPNISFGAPVMKWITADLPIDAHLMIENPEKYIKDFVKAGADTVIVHSETVDDLAGTLQMIKDLGVEAGVSIKPKTPISDIKDVLPMLDQILIMTVEPGFGGQSFMEDQVGKIKDLREMGYEKDIAVDGGINAETSKICRDAGANILIAGSYIFKAKDRRAAIENLKA